MSGPARRCAPAAGARPVRGALRKLGGDIRDARRRRRIATVTMAERASLSRMTLNKIEKGDLSVSLGIYATVLFALGMTEAVLETADYYGLTAPDAKRIAVEVAVVASAWRSEAARLSITRREIDRMASAFEHGDLEKSLRLE